MPRIRPSQIAAELQRHIAESYREQLLVFGCYGSAARGEDTVWSDLDLLLISRTGAGIPSRSFLYQQIPVTLTVIEQAELESILTGPTLRWPFWMGVLAELRPFAGDATLIDTWLQLGQTPSSAAFRATLSSALPELVYESYGRLQSCRVRGNASDAACAVIELLLEMQTALCMINQRWITRGYSTGLAQTASFPLLPEQYATLAPALWDAQDLASMAQHAEALMAHYEHLLAECGLTVPAYQTLAEL